MSRAEPSSNEVCPGNLIHGTTIAPSRRFDVPVMITPGSPRTSPRTPLITIDATGAVGVTAALADDQGPQPAPFKARTVNEYAVPFLSPVTSQDVVEPRHDPPGGVEITWYVDTSNEPVDSGGDHETETALSPATPATFKGADGG